MDTDVGAYEIAVSLDHPGCDASYTLFDCSGPIDIAEIFVFPGTVWYDIVYCVSGWTFVLYSLSKWNVD